MADPDTLLGWFRRIWHLSMAVAAFTVARYSNVVDLSLFTGDYARAIMFSLSAVNLLLTFRVSWAGSKTFYLNFAGILLGCLFATSRASSFLDLVLNGDAQNATRPDLWGAVTERWLLGVSIAYVHLVNIRRPWAHS